MPLLHPTTSIRTYTGEIFDVLHPKPEQIHIEDIAHALSNLCRFGGHTSQFYSVAQHSVIMAGLNDVPDEYKLTALLHDASEAYVVDMPSPIKQLLPKYIDIESDIQLCIARRFGLDYPWHEVIDRADLIMLRKEMILQFDLRNGISWSPMAAEKLFLIEFRKLTTGR
jgi:hypothetical protein